MEEINLVDHPFKRKMKLRVGESYRAFGYEYFDSPGSPTGFRGYRRDGNGAEGKRDFAQEAAAIASIPGVLTVLDVGCAKGFLVKALRDLGVEAYGVDVSEYAVNSAEASIRRFLRVARAQDIGQSERYDLIHVSGVFVYLCLSEIKMVLRRFYDVSRAGIIVDEPTLEDIMEWYEAGDVAGLDPMRRQELSQAEWERLVTEAGFEKDVACYRRRGGVAGGVSAPVAAYHALLPVRDS